MPVSKNMAPDLGLSLAHAIVSSSDAPLLLLDGELGIIAASDAFYSVFSLDSNAVLGRKLSALGAGEWAVPQLAALLNATASGMAEVKGYEFELRRPNSPVRCLVVNAHKLAYGDKAQTRVLLSIADVTDARLAERIRDDLLQEKANLFRELQHRVANSLQIVASVLLQNARKVQSRETRLHLQDAHHRVMSIAALQKQLASTGDDTVALRPYFTQLCETIGASMIRDRKQIHLGVIGDDSRVDADASISLGLVVTELVINALKHAFPDDRYGKIIVDYRSEGPEWALSVADDGVGMMADPQAGLGSSIINALAEHLHADVVVTAGSPGTRVSLIHPPGRVDSQPETVA